MRIVSPYQPTAPTVRESVLREAIEITSSDRNVQYGEPEQNFSTIAEFWTTYFHRRGLLKDGARIEGFDTAVAQMLVKVARIGVSPTKKDHWVDAAGYSAGGYEVAVKEKENEQAPDKRPV